jgi:hypothetical protein
MAKFNVSNIINDNGNAASNQFIINTPKATYFQSYDSVVAKIDEKRGNLILSDNWDYSNTTRKHLYIFLRMHGFCHLCSAKDMRNAIKNKEVILKKVSSLDIA